MGEAAIQPGLVIAAVGVRREPGGLIAPRGQVLGQGRIRGIERELPLGIELERPLAGEEAAMRGVRPRGGRQGAVDTGRPSAPTPPGWAWCPADSRRGSGCRRGRCPRRSARRCGRRRRRRQSGHRAGLRTACRPDERAARTTSRPRSAARIDRSGRESRPRAATASLIGRPSPAARSRLQAPYSGNLSRAAQIASVANSHDAPPQRDEPRPEPVHGGDHHAGDQQQDRVAHRDGPGEIPPDSERTPRGFKQNFLKSMRTRSR